MSSIVVRDPIMQAPSLVELLEWRADSQPDQPAYTFLIDGEQDERILSYRDLMRKARALGAYLQSLGATGERVLLLYPPGLDYIVAFFGCLYAGATAVPAYPPNRNRSTPRLEAIVADARPAFLLTPAASRADAQHLYKFAPYLERLRWVASDDIADDLSDQWVVSPADGNRLAFLQYTSGSTASPKGVMLTHQNLLHNLELIRQAFRHTRESRGVIWLPPYHDMGLIGGILQPLYVGFPVVLLSPLTFLQRPYTWLQAISRYRATTSGGPNFAYDLCAAKITPEQREQLDFSCWQVAFNGAEVVRHATLERFAATFAESGFRRESFYPCYGLAEATLFVAGGAADTLPGSLTVAREALRRHRVQLAKDEAGDTQVLISCGWAGPDHQIRVVHPETAHPCNPDEVGEIWVHGPSVAQGYWQRPEESIATFNAALTDGSPERYLRTGDLGFLRDGELFITGRRKELMIIRGRNYYPQDIEQAVAQSHPALRPNSGAAFSVEVDGQERLAIVHEVYRSARHQAAHAIAAAIRQAVASEFELTVHAVVLITEASLPRTSSGKIQRLTCRDQYLSGTLKALYTDVAENAAIESAQPLDSALTEQVAALEPTAARALVTEHLREQLASALNLPATLLEPDKPLNELGIDSLMALTLQHGLATKLGLSLSAATFLEGHSLEHIAADVLDQLGAASHAQAPVLSPAILTEGSFPLSYGQQAMWFLHRLAPESAAYHIYSAIRIRSALDPDLLRAALQALVDRQAMLRVTIQLSDDGIPMQRVQPAVEVCFSSTDASAWQEQQITERLVELAQQPFDLHHDSLLRVHHFACTPAEQILLVVVHHSIADFWSLALLTHELVTLYQARSLNADAQLEELRYQYADFVHWQRDQIESMAGEALWAYWQTQLAGAPFTLELPTDRPRPAIQGYRGASQRISLGERLTDELKTLSKLHGATLYMTLLAAFQTLLYRYTQQDDLLIGSPVVGRSQPAFTGIVGYFVNPLVLRARLAGNPTFEELLHQVRQTVLDALRHQDFPFALLAERLQPHRDPSRTPLFQVMFIYQQAPAWIGEQFAALALGSSGHVVTVGGFEMEAVSLPNQPAQFDLTLVMAETDAGLEASFQYNCDLFEDQTISAWLQHFHQLLASIAQDPAQHVTRFELLPAVERERLLLAWNDSARPYQLESCLHHLFEAQVDRTPQAVAVVFADQELTYQELSQQANQFARHLQALGVGPGSTVAVYIERSAAMVVALLGILKAGAAYLPLDLAQPDERLHTVLEDARVAVAVTQRSLLPRLAHTAVPKVCMDVIDLTQHAGDNLKDGVVSADHLAYVIYTSGSTGRPKGVMVTHRNVVNFCQAIQEHIGCGPQNTCLALTNISFDISVLELFAMLSSGAKVVLLSEQAIMGSRRAQRPSRELDFSLFYFANDEAAEIDDRYRLLREGAIFADAQGFKAVWTPERHFHAFGGLYPNPAVTGAALAALTQQIEIRAGSVVLPLHHPIRIAEEWAVVDNLSRGRTGIAFASGWHADDFALRPENYAERKDLTWQGIETIQRLWRGEAVTVQGGGGNAIDVRIFPRPVQSDLPIWLTAAGNPETFQKAGELGLHVLTHLLGQSIDELVDKIKLYRDARAANGHNPEAGKVTLMLHTFLGDDLGQVRQTVRQPFKNYLRTSVGLVANLVRSLNLPLNLASMSDEDMEGLLDYAFDRYFETSALFGTLESCRPLIERLQAIGVDEVACLIDFGVETTKVLDSLPTLRRLKDQVELAAAYVPPGDSLIEQALRHQPTLMQCTPSLMQMLGAQPGVLESLESLRALLLGGETLPAPLAQSLVERGIKLYNMYGPTETTVWSTCHEVMQAANSIPIGRPLANNQVYVLDPYYQPVPVGVPGELYIGGAGVARGYLHRPELTAERFVPDPFNAATGARLYRTGDFVRWSREGRLEFLGRRDHQIKIRGMRLELGEIEAALSRHSAVDAAVVAVQQHASLDKQLLAYLTLKHAPDRHDIDQGAVVSATALRTFLKERLPDHMIPADFIVLESLPLLPSGKIDRKALAMLSGQRLALATDYVAPDGDIQQALAVIWQLALQRTQIGAHDNFFDLGGNSLLMVQVHTQLQQRFPAHTLPLVKLFEHPTIAALAQYLSREQAEQPSYEQSQDRARLQREGQRRQRHRAREIKP